MSRLFCIFLIFFGCTICFAEDPIKLFSKEYTSLPPEEFYQTIKDLKQGQILDFARGKYKYEVIKELGEGSMTVIYKVKVIKPKKDRGKLMALRLPKALDEVVIAPGKKPPFFLSMISLGIRTVRYKDLIDIYVKGTKELKSSKIRMPDVYHHKKGQFVTVEIIEDTFDLNEFLNMKGRALEHGDETIKAAEEALYKIAKPFSKFESLNDFHSRQLVYSKGKNEWVFLDMMDLNSPYTLVDRIHPFNFDKSPFRNIPMEKSETTDLMVRRQVILSTLRKKIQDHRSFFLNAEKIRCMKDSLEGMLN